LIGAWTFSEDVFPSWHLRHLCKNRSMKSTPQLFRRPGFWIVFFTIAFGIAVLLDIPVTTWVHDSGLSAHLKLATSQRWTLILRIPGNFVKSTIPFTAILLVWGFARRQHPTQAWWKPAAVVFLAGTFSGINSAFKWIFGRIRPFHGSPPFALHPFMDGFRGLLHAEAALSFPSGDVSHAFAWATSLSIVWPAGSYLWFALAIEVIFERIAEGAHYPSDTVGGAALGIFAGWLAARLLKFAANKPRARGFEPTMIDPGSINTGG
jgi:membrane-associated phospholipid phosphatase